MKGVVGLLSLFLCFPLFGLTQVTLGIHKTRPEIRQEFSHYAEKNRNSSLTLAESDTSISVKVTSKEAVHTDFYFRFDKAGTCTLQKTISYCDTCSKSLIQELLSQGKYGWKKINENQWVSSFEQKLLLESSPSDKDYHFTVMRTEWTKELYQLLLAN